METTTSDALQDAMLARVDATAILESVDELVRRTETGTLNPAEADEIAVYALPKLIALQAYLREQLIGVDPTLTGIV